MRSGDGVVQRANRCDESVGLAREVFVFSKEEDGGHEVVLARAFVESADQIRDRNVELGGVNHGRVQQQASRGRLDGLGLAFSHSQQHLEFDAVANAASPGQRPRKGDVEQIVTGNTDLDVRDTTGRERVVEYALVVGVSVLLRVHRGQSPAVNFGIDTFHRQVGALDDANLDGRTAACTTGARPFLKANHRAKCVGQVRLKDDSGFEVEEFIPVEDVLEHRDRHVEIVVLLHVEVDELARFRLDRDPIHGKQLLDDVSDCLIKRPGRMRRNGGGDLDGHVVDVGAGQQVDGSLQALGCFGRSQHGLAEQIDVEVDTACTKGLQLCTEFRRRRVDDEVAHHSAKNAARNRDNDSGDVARRKCAETD